MSETIKYSLWKYRQALCHSF